MNVETELRNVVKSGKVALGAAATTRSLRSGKGKLGIISENCPQGTLSEIRMYSAEHKIPVFVFSGTSQDLGNVCKKPFPVSAMVVFEAGGSKIFDVVKEK